MDAPWGKLQKIDQNNVVNSDGLNYTEIFDQNLIYKLNFSGCALFYNRISPTVHSKWMGYNYQMPSSHEKILEVLYTY